MRSVRNWENICGNILYAGMGMVFFMLCVILLNNQGTAYTELCLVPLAGLAVGGVMWIWSCIQKHEKQLEQYYGMILAVVLVFFFIIHCIMGRVLRFTPAWDLDAIYGGAIEWAETGSFSSYYMYFEENPNNLGALLFYHVLFFLIKTVGITDYFSAAALVNSLGVLVSVCLVSLICRKKFGISAGIFVLALFLISPPFYFMPPVFYTDCLSMPYPVIFYYLYLKAEEEWEGNPKHTRRFLKILLFGVLGGIAIGVGSEIKMTVAIMLIAVLADCLLYRKWKKTAWFWPGCLAGMLCVLTIFSVTIYGEGKLDRARVEERKLPVSYFIMLGLNEESVGKHNTEDRSWATGISTAEERKEAMTAEIRNRLKDMGVGGVNDHIMKKIGIDFNGTYGLSDFLDDSPAKRGVLHEFILYDGRFYKIYLYICQAVYMAVILLMTVSVIRNAIMEQTADKQMLAPRLAVFGLCILLAVWETRDRYATNFIPIIFLCAAMGIGPVYRGWSWIRKHRRNREDENEMA